MSEWISVKDRLPITGQVVLFYSDRVKRIMYGYNANIASSKKPVFYSFCDGYFNPSHWMPLPDPPEGTGRTHKGLPQSITLDAALRSDGGCQ